MEKIGEEASEEEVSIEEIEIEYDSNTVLDISPISILRKNKKKQIFVIISKSDGSWESSKQELDDVFELPINEGVNNFKIRRL